jgi:micrococcal nuclease
VYACIRAAPAHLRPRCGGGQCKRQLTAASFRLSLPCACGCVARVLISAGKSTRLLAAVALALILAAPAGADDAQSARVFAVVDGDTVRVHVDGRPRTVRLIGVDTPELRDRHNPTAPPQPFAREAADFTRRALNGQRVRLEYEPHDRFDVYGRTLAYVFLDDGTFFNRELVRTGYARAYRRFRFRYRKQFIADEAAARREGRGLWGSPAISSSAAPAPR